MKKFFQFSESINGTTYFLRCLFSIVLSIPFFIILMLFLGISTSEYVEALKNTFTPFWVISIIISLIPAIWFGIATYYKRVAALFVESKDKIFAGLIAFEILADYIVFEYGWGSESIIGSFFALATLLIFVYMVFQNSGIEEHEG